MLSPFIKHKPYSSSPACSTFTGGTLTRQATYSCTCCSLHKRAQQWGWAEAGRNPHTPFLAINLDTTLYPSRRKISFILNCMKFSSAHVHFLKIKTIYSHPTLSRLYWDVCLSGAPVRLYHTDNIKPLVLQCISNF